MRILVVVHHQKNWMIILRLLQNQYRIYIYMYIYIYGFYIPTVIESSLVRQQEQQQHFNVDNDIS